MSNLETVQNIYEAFGRGDVPAILEAQAPDAEWDVFPNGNHGQDAGVPWLQARRGHDEVAGFFAVIAEALEFHSFQPVALMDGGTFVTALIDVEATVKATGNRVADREVHVWELGEDGKVVRLNHIVDTGKHAAACSG